MQFTGLSFSVFLLTSAMSTFAQTASDAKYFDNAATSISELKSTTEINQTKENSRVYILTSKLNDTETTLGTPAIKQEFERSKALIQQLSYGIQHMELVGVQELKRSPYNRQQIKQWADTSSILYQSFTQNGGHPYNGKCDLAKQWPIAQAYLDNLSEDYKNRYAISIKQLDLTFVKQYIPATPCKELSIGDIWMHTIELPNSIDLSNIDILVFTPIDDILHAGGYQSGLPYVNFKNSDLFNTKHKSDIDRVSFVLSGLIPSELSFQQIHSSYLESQGDWDNSSVELNKYVIDKDYVQTNYSRVLSHEFMHALGLGTHDDGLDFYTDSKLVVKTNMEPEPHNALSYGDYFSVLGKSNYATGLSPVQREYLGWLKGRVIHINQGNNSYSIKPLSSKTGKVVAKVKVNNLPNPGYLYLSYESGNDEYAGLNWKPLSENSKGLLLRFAQDTGKGGYEDKGYGNLTTSILLDPDGNVRNESFALMEGQSFTLAEVTVTVEKVSAEQLDFSVKY